MKKRLLHQFALPGLCLFVVLFSFGCAAKAKYTSLKDLGTVKVEILSSQERDARISAADAYQKDGELWVTGVVSQEGALFPSFKGHVDVAVIAPGKDEVKLGTAEYKRFPSRHRRTSFEVRFPVIAEQGTLVRLMFHRTDDGGSKHTAAIESLQ